MKLSKNSTKIVSLFLVLIMLGGSVQWNYIAEAAVAVLTEAPGFKITFKDPGSSGNVTKVGNDFTYLMSKSVDGIFPVSFEPEQFPDTDYMKNVQVTIELPYLYFDANNILQMTYEKPADATMGIEVMLAADDNWSVDTNNIDLDAEVVDGYHRGSLVVKRDRVSVISQFSLKFRFFGAVPENASAAVMLGATYDTYVTPGGTLKTTM